MGYFQTVATTETEAIAYKIGHGVNLCSLFAVLQKKVLLGPEVFVALVTEHML